MTRVRLKRLVATVCGVAAVGLPGVCIAQQAEPGAAREASPRSDAESRSAPRASREVARMAAMDLQIAGGNNPRDYRIAELLLGVAHQLAPDDEVILRLEVFAASSSGNRESLIALTKELVRLNPSDTVAQLRLIAGAIDTKQDIEGRMAGYDAFLNYRDKDGHALDASIRSRLALDAALLLREKGDLRGFAEKLAMAAELDPTNKDAASLAVTFYTENSGDAPGRLALLINLLKADPFDADTHLAIARELAAGDAVTQATRFYETHGSLVQLFGDRVSPNVTAEANTLYWSAEGAERLVERLREAIEQQRSAAGKMRQLAIERDQPLSQLPDPERVRLTPELERVRLAAALAIGDQAQADYCYAETARTFDLQLSAIQDENSRPPGTTQQEVLDTVKRLRGELMWMQLWSGYQIPAAEAVLNEFKQDPAMAASPQTAPVLRRLEGWLQLQKGELDAAEKTLTPLASSDVLARLGLCVLKERRGAKEEAISAFEALARETAGSLVGAYARTRYGVLSGHELERAPGAKELESLAAGVPGWLEDMITDPRRAMSLQASVEPDRIGPMDPARVRIRVRNVSPIALALGPEKPINSRLLLVPKLEAALDPVRAAAGSVVVSLDRRLRLLPQEELDITVWADQGNMGWITNRLITVPLTVKWKAIQGFNMVPPGVYVQGPHCLAIETEWLQRSSSAKSFDDGPTLVKWIESGSSEDIAEVITLAQVNLQVKKDARGAWPADQRQAIGAALAARYPKLDAPSRIMIAAMLPLPKQAPWLKPVDDAIAADADPRVRMVCLALRTPDPKDAKFAAAASGDARLAELASLVQGRLEAGTKTFATVLGGDSPPAEETPSTPSGGTP